MSNTPRNTLERYLSPENATGREFVQLVYENLEVRHLKRRFPLSMYTQLP